MPCQHCAHCAPSVFDILMTIKMSLEDDTAFRLTVCQKNATFIYAGHLYTLTVKKEKA